MDDEETRLIERIHSEDSEALSKLVKLYFETVSSWVKIWVPGQTKEAREDINQEIWVRVFRGIEDFELRSGFKTWLRAVAYNTTITVLRRLWKESGLVENRDTIDISFIHEDLNLSPSQWAEHKNFADHVFEALKMLKIEGKLKHRHISVYLLHLKSYKNTEIADMLGITRSYVGKLLWKARDEVKNSLSEKYEYSAEEITPLTEFILEHLPEYLQRQINQMFQEVE